MAVYHIPIRGKTVGVDQHPRARPVRFVERGEELMEIDRDGLPYHHVVLLRPEYWGQQLRRLARHVKPRLRPFGPAKDGTPAPGFHRLAQGVFRGPAQYPERISVQINLTRLLTELTRQRGQFIAGVEFRNRRKRHETIQMRSG